MPTTQQKLLNQWVERNYKKLLRTMPQKDMLHSAYIAIYYLRRPYLPTADTFLQLMSEAYHRCILREIKHSMRYTLPDPAYWLIVGDNMTDDSLDIFAGQMDDGAEEVDKKHSSADLETKQLNNLLMFIRNHVKPDDYIIFRLALLQQCDIAQIAAITGRTKPEIRRSMEEIEKLIRKEYHPRRRK
ncbi:MAG: hypothetical protein IJ640_01410 [Prevotella sp.]|nr:hypothetical protein [Prevotella sp.]